MTHLPSSPSRKPLRERILIGACFVAGSCALVLLAFALVTEGALIHASRTCQERSGTASEVRSLRSAARVYKSKTGRYPSPEVGLGVLVSSGVLSELPKDPWGRPFRYALRDGEPVVWTLGADDAPGGDQCDRDLSSDDPEDAS